MIEIKKNQIDLEKRRALKHHLFNTSGPTQPDNSAIGEDTSTEFLSLILITVLFWFVNRHEKIYGPIGEHQDKKQNNDTT